MTPGALLPYVVGASITLALGAAAFGLVVLCQEPPDPDPDPPEAVPPTIAQIQNLDL